MVGTSSCVAIGKGIEAEEIARQRMYRFEREYGFEMPACVQEPAFAGPHGRIKMFVD